LLVMEGSLAMALLEVESRKAKVESVGKSPYNES
jgi:hypothetical protein